MSIQRIGKNYKLYRNGKPFEVKGASGDSHFKMLADCGGNTVRIWDTTHLGVTLDSAQKNNLAVIVGLPIESDATLSFFQNADNVKKQYAAFSHIVKKYKSHPALLMWCLGNEIQFPNSLFASNFYDAYNNLTDMIHEVDPDHPITTTVGNFNIKLILNLSLRCDIDLISFNIFGDLPLFRKKLDKFSLLWSGPFMVLEWGVDGPWHGSEETAWSTYIEDASWKKAEVHKERYLKYMPTENPRFLGAFVFFWGNKQEYTHTWYSLFDENGAPSETVEIMRELWSQKPPQRKFPNIEYMLLDKRGARDNIMLNPDALVNAELVAPKLSETTVRIKWELYQEDWYKKDNMNSDRKIPPLKGLIVSDNSMNTMIKTPKAEGPYRLFVTVYDKNGTFASCNTPFYVVNP